MLPKGLEEKIGAAVMNKRNDAIQRQLTIECPPINPHLIKHLEVMFSYPVDADVKHPQLGQLLMIQYGVEKVLEYLRYHHQGQAAAAEKDHAK